jgi:hypothetical protein
MVSLMLGTNMIIERHRATMKRSAMMPQDEYRPSILLSSLSHRT